MPPAYHLHQAAGVRPRWEVADIFRAHGVAYRKAHPLPRLHMKVMRAIERCIMFTRERFAEGREVCDGARW